MNVSVLCTYVRGSDPRKAADKTSAKAPSVRLVVNGALGQAALSTIGEVILRAGRRLDDPQRELS